MLNETTYSKALVRIKPSDVIACHQFSSPQDATGFYRRLYAWRAVNCKKKKEKKKGRRRTSLLRLGRIIGFEADGRLKVHMQVLERI